MHAKHADNSEMNGLSGRMTGCSTTRRKGVHKRHPGRCLFGLASRALRSKVWLRAYEPP